MTETGTAPRKQLVSFGITMAVAFSILAGVRVWRRGLEGISIAVFIVAGVFALCAFLAPEMLRPVFRWWMKLAEILGWINTRILLVLIFFLVVTPLGFLMRLFGRNPLDFRKRDSYWTEPPRNSYGDKHYEKQF